MARFYLPYEISAPEGYLLDENPIKEIFIYESDDNKQYSLLNRRTSKSTKLPESVFDMAGQIWGVPDDELETYLGGEEYADG